MRFVLGEHWKNFTCIDSERLLAVKLSCEDGILKIFCYLVLHSVPHIKLLLILCDSASSCNEDKADHNIAEILRVAHFDFYMSTEIILSDSHSILS